MAKFIIDGTDFGIDPTELTFSVDEVDGTTIVNVEVRGNQDKYDAASEDEDFKWSWTLYPPEFYLRDFPALL